MKKLTETCFSERGLNCLLVLLIAAEGLLSFFAPLTHNPDANYYYGMVLSLSKGGFRQAIDIMYSPLLSWLMLPTYLLGLDLNGSFRIVNFIAFAFILIAVQKLSPRFVSSSILIFFIILLTALNLAYFSIALITPDILATAIFLWAFYFITHDGFAVNKKLLCFAGVLGGFLYYAKAAELPIFLISLLGLSLINRGSKIAGRYALCALITLLLSSPWISAVSYKAGQPLISGQQLIMSGRADFADYSPVSEFPLSNFSNPKAVSGIASITWSDKSSRPASLINAAISDLESVYDQIASFFFGSIISLLYFFLCFIGLSSRAKINADAPGTRRHLQTLALFCLVHIGCYVFVYGPLLRFYFPIIPLLHFLCFRGIEGVFRYVQKFSSLFRYSLGVFAGIAACSILVIHIALIEHNWHSIDEGFLDYASSIAILRDHHGILSGTANSPYSSLISYSLGRAYWNSIRAERNESTEILMQRLKDWKVEQLICFGEVPGSIKGIPNSEVLGPFRQRELSFYIINLPKLE